MFIIGGHLVTLYLFRDRPDLFTQIFLQMTNYNIFLPFFLPVYLKFDPHVSVGGLNLALKFAC